MPNIGSTGSRILAAHASHSANMTADLQAARVAGAPVAELAALEERALAAQRMYLELAVDLPQQPSRRWWLFASRTPDR